MKSALIVPVLGLLLAASQTFATEDPDEFYKTNNCLACHRIDRATLGPSFKTIAAKYVDDKGADLMLAKKIREGGMGVWGQVPMPAQPQVNETEALTLARWILALK